MSKLPLFTSFFCLSLLLALPAKAALLLNVDAQAETMEWVSGQTTFTGAADLGFLFGDGVGNIIRFTAPEPERTGDFDNASGMTMEIIIDGSQTAIVGIRLIVGGTFDSSDGSLIGTGPGATAPTFSSGYSFASFGDTPSGTYTLAALPESSPLWDAPVQVNFTAVPEPSAYAALFAAIALGFAFRKRKHTSVPSSN